MFGIGQKKSPVDAFGATGLSSGHVSAVVNASATRAVPVPVEVEPDWSQLDHFHNTPSAVFEAVAEASGTDLLAARLARQVVQAAQPVAIAPEVIRETVIVPTHYVEDRVRSGTVIRAEGDLVICGDVSSGAELIAGGSVHVLGTCSGRVYAGVPQGDHPVPPHACVFILHCRAELISIDGTFLCFEQVPSGLLDRSVLFSRKENQLIARPFA